MNTDTASIDGFAPALLHWYDRHGRKDLPWQRERDAYRVWLSEVMLQQTQVRTVIPYFERFLAALPTLAELAAAPQDRVLALWSGLGYYSRARNLHRTAQICVAEHGGELPRALDALSALPGIGRSTAAAILAQTWNERHAILDGNVRRVLARWHGLRGWPGETATQRELWRLAEQHTPHERVADYTQAIMDLGATLCVRARPHCTRCPVATGCVALREGLTAELPARKPARAKPTRKTTMLIVRDAQRRVLLERRPSVGIWASLWSLPEIDTAAEAPRHLLERYAVRADGGAALAPFVHVFSHYTLEITPLLLEHAQPVARVADADDRAWYAPAELAGVGLPAPVRKLLDTLNDEDLLR
ncbi:A/G-specific adenine glycosylase [Dokdonella sp.]|uniref:A/G-specific adenine glycosylase n=1 Tax=Dokdonella sp. TaxID=2291710 RepID=UPI001B09E85B|nr:A/G-specific adenine glycosylase [Dokdonella sp.]MBO9664937.1 A/G-specific adenine glycosylase [Dokdonella sp.]